MTPNEIKSAIATSLGWADIEPIAQDDAPWGREGGMDGPLRRVPDYHCSLDVIVPVVRAMPEDEREEVISRMPEITRGYIMCLATPSQWCRAYLAQKGLWK